MRSKINQTSSKMENRNVDDDLENQINVGASSSSGAGGVGMLRKNMKNMKNEKNEKATAPKKKAAKKAAPKKKTKVETFDDDSD